MKTEVTQLLPRPSYLVSRLIGIVPHIPHVLLLGSLLVVPGVRGERWVRGNTTKNSLCNTYTSLKKQRKEEQNKKLLSSPSVHSHLPHRWFIVVAEVPEAIVLLEVRVIVLVHVAVGCIALVAIKLLIGVPLAEHKLAACIYCSFLHLLPCTQAN